MCKIVYTHHVPCNHTCFVGYLYCALFYFPHSPRRGLICVNVHALGPLDTPPFAPFSPPLFPLEPNLSTSLLNSPISEILNNPIDEQLNLALPSEEINTITPLPEELLTVQVDTLDAPCVTCEGTRILYGGETRAEWEGRRERWLDVWEKGIEDGLWWGDGYTFGQRINTDEHFATFVHRTFTEKQQRLADLAYQQRLQPSDNTHVDTMSIQDIFMESSDAAYLVNREMAEDSIDSGDSDTTETLPVIETASGSSADPDASHPIKTLPLPLLPTPFDPVAGPSQPIKTHPATIGTPPCLRTPFETAVDSLPPLPPLHLPERRRRSITINPDTHTITFGGSPAQPQQYVDDTTNIAIRGNPFGTSTSAMAGLAASDLRTNNNNEAGVEKGDYGRDNENPFVID